MSPKIGELLPVRTATLIVAASNATTSSKRDADYVCLGVADDVTIQAAIDALPAAGGSIEFSEGKFVLTAALEVPDNVLLTGKGYASRLDRETVGDAINAVGTSGARRANVVVELLRITGPSTSGTNVVGKGVDLDYADRCTVHHCWISGWGSSADDGAVAVRHAVGCSVVHNHLSESKNGLISGQGTSTDFPEADRCDFSHNTVYDNFDDGIHPQQGQKNRIVGNTCYGNGGAGIDLLGELGDTVAANECYDNTGSGIEVGNTSGVGSADRRNTITGNVCQTNGASGIFLETSASYNTIVGNTCSDNTAHGIYLANSHSGSDVSDNTVVGNTCDDNTGNGILIHGNVDRNNVTGNTCRSNGSRGITIAVISTKVPNDNAIWCNYLSDNTTANYSDAGTATVEANNVGTS